MATHTTSRDQDNYTFERKKRLASKISEVRDKTILRQIKNIIFEENPDAIAKKSSGGYLMFFQNYANNTYIRLEELLANLETERLHRQTKSIAKASETLISSEDQCNDYETSRSRLRYSNREKRLIKRQQYEIMITKQHKEHLEENVIESSPITESAKDTDQNTSDDDNIQTHAITVAKTEKNRKSVDVDNTSTMSPIKKSTKPSTKSLPNTITTSQTHASTESLSNVPTKSRTKKTITTPINTHTTSANIFAKIK